MKRILSLYLSGDGSIWLKSGLEYLLKNKFVLDKYHMNKYILKIAIHAKIWRARNITDKKTFRRYMNKLK